MKLIYLNKRYRIGRSYPENKIPHRFPWKSLREEQIELFRKSTFQKKDFDF